MARSSRPADTAPYPYRSPPTDGRRASPTRSPRTGSGRPACARAFSRVAPSVPTSSCNASVVPWCTHPFVTLYRRACAQRTRVPRWFRRRDVRRSRETLLLRNTRCARVRKGRGAVPSGYGRSTARGTRPKVTISSDTSSSVQ